MWRMAKNLPQHSVIAMDGSWSQRQNASYCAIHLIDVASVKIVDFDILEKPIGFSDGNDFHSSNGVKIEASIISSPDGGRMRIWIPRS
jgi:hypothetical protein